MTTAPRYPRYPRYRALPLGGSLAAHFEQHADGTTLVTSTESLQPFPERLTDRLLHWAAVTPDHTLVAKPKVAVLDRNAEGAMALAAELPTAIQDSLAASIPFRKRLGKPAALAQLASSIIENIALNGEVIRLDGALRMAPR